MAVGPYQERTNSKPRRRFIQLTGTPVGEGGSAGEGDKYMYMYWCRIMCWITISKLHLTIPCHENTVGGYKPQVDRVSVRGKFGGSSSSSSRSECPGFESPCGAIVCSLAKRASEGEGEGEEGLLAKRAVCARVEQKNTNKP